MRLAPLPTRLVGVFAELVRWGEPWDVEDDDDPLLERPSPLEPATLWS